MTKYPLTKSVTIPMFDVKEEGYCFGLNHVIQFRCKASVSKNMHFSSVLQSCRRSVMISGTIHGVFV